MQEYTDYMQEDEPEPEAPSGIKTNKRRFSKMIKKFGCICLISGIVVLSIALASGLPIIPLVIGGYLIGNGLINTLVVKL